MAFGLENWAGRDHEAFEKSRTCRGEAAERRGGLLHRLEFGLAQNRTWARSAEDFSVAIVDPGELPREAGAFGAAFARSSRNRANNAASRIFALS